MLLADESSGLRGSIDALLAIQMDDYEQPIGPPEHGPGGLPQGMDRNSEEVAAPIPQSSRELLALFWYRSSSVRASSGAAAARRGRATSRRVMSLW